MPIPMQLKYVCSFVRTVFLLNDAIICKKKKQQQQQKTTHPPNYSVNF
jgi:hypothetical protein